LGFPSYQPVALQKHCKQPTPAVSPQWLGAQDEQSRLWTLGPQEQEPPTSWQMSLMDPFSWQLQSV